MPRKKTSRILRITHRWLGVFFGIQFLFWTAGGLYFSWTDLSHIRGDNLRRAPASLMLPDSVFNPASVLGLVKNSYRVERLDEIEIINLPDQAYYRISFFNGVRRQTVLAELKSGRVRGELNAREALEIARASLRDTAPVQSVRYIRKTNGHHEYRKKPLPAYAITFGNPVNSTLYIAAESGAVESYRNRDWRIFDFLWMLHTMDYTGRDNFNNWVLRLFSVAGLLTIFTGLGLVFFQVRTKGGPYRNRKAQTVRENTAG